MGFLRFEEIIAWQKAKEITLLLHQLLKKNRDFTYKDQILRATLSVMNNIAEGYERQTNKEFKQFLYIAKGSCGEIRSMLHVGLELKYFDDVNFKKLLDLCIQTAKILSALIKTLN